MSKYDLRSRAHALSGVSYESSLLVKTSLLRPSILEIIGGVDGVRRLSELFYDRVYADVDAPWFVGIFASSTKDEAVDNQYRYLVQEFGGPALYTEKGKGKYVRLVGRHANYKIGIEAAGRWLHHMEGAISEHDMLGGEEREVARTYLVDYFRYTAYYIVVASEYMRDDQLSGGTQLDGGRIW